MANSLNHAVENGFRKMLQLDGEIVTYRHGDEEVPLTVLVDSVNEESSGWEKVACDREKFQMAVFREEMSVNGNLYVPQRGDKVQRGGEMLEVISGPNDRPWDYEEAGRIVLVFYAQKIVA